MCDSFAFFNDTFPENTFHENKGCWLAKNSDREPEEPQRVEWHESYVGGAFQETTYIEVPVPEKRVATWISRPDWMWGAEMGVNEYGVAIGNEAVFTRLINRKSSALLGMDLVRLALQQSQSADQALSVITEYLQRYGQGGAAGFKSKNFFYDNSFLIADAGSGWQLETAGQFWVAKKLDSKNPIIAISNDLSIGTDFDLCSNLLQDKAKEAGYWNGKGDFNFRNTFATWFMPWAGRAKQRQTCNIDRLNKLDHQQPIAPQIAKILRQHKDGNSEHSSNADVCMHATSVLRPSQTTQSMICHLAEDNYNSWMTGGSAPCVSLYKPLLNTKGDAKKSWLLQHPDFWEDWNMLYQKTETNRDFKDKLQQYNLQIENQLWNVKEKELPGLLDEWWSAVKSF